MSEKKPKVTNAKEADTEVVKATEEKPQPDKADIKAPKAMKAPTVPFYMYIGPPIRGVISKNAIYPADKIELLDDALSKYPDIKHLLIPADKLGIARATIKKPESFLAVAYKRLAARA